MSEPLEQSENGPSWESLPHDPEAFFELQPGFVRRDLKRSYSKLIRVYKPERHPEQFQRIRAAYEQLDSQLRYGKAAAKPQAEDWVRPRAQPSDESKQVESVPSDPGDTLSPAQRLTSRVLAESPKKLYDEISERANKSPYDFYSLAVLSDLLKPRKPLRFSRWLVKGIAAHTFDPSLLHLLREDLARAAPLDALPELLVQCAQAVPRDDFYALTEPAWERLLRVLPFAQFMKLLENCEQHLRDISIAYRVTFMMRVLRYAVWSDNNVMEQQEWIEAAFQFVEENFQSIPAQLEMELELLVAVGNYAKVREDFLNGNPLRAQMDAALKSYMTSEQALSDQAVLEVQLAMLADPQAVLEAIPSEEDQAVVAFYSAWAWATADVADRYGAKQGEADARLWSDRLSSVIESCHGRAAKNSAMVAYSMRAIAVTIATQLACIIGIVVVGFLIVLSVDAMGPSALEEYGGWLMLAMLGVVVGGAVFMVRLHRKQHAKRRTSSRKQRLDRFLYSTIYRQDILGFIQHSQVSFYVVRDYLSKERYYEKQEHLDAMRMVVRDFGLAFYSLALPFQT
ncbi:J domain-containing protein [Adhaeretor mobilis]|uniref:J domain-containing protein n=1 Tax=Adhaeretor mobilis TaxID=1930276 RepID=A0A517MPE6_9BACT|nr:J domain-containing protein [Adhaeretor mobilis]QDS96755.1 hypothetical protein HG15A2_00130 [Adhaeretor mobilis]